MKRKYEGDELPKRRPSRWLLPLCLVLVAIVALAGFCYLFPPKGTLPEMNDIHAYFMRTRVSERFVIAEQDAWFESDYVVPASFLGIHSDFTLRFRVLVHLSFALSLDAEGWGLKVTGDKVTVQTPPMTLLEPSILSETFEILREDRSILVDEETKKTELFKSLSPWIREQAPKVADFAAAREKGAISVAGAVRKSFDMFGKKAGSIEILIP